MDSYMDQYRTGPETLGGRYMHLFWHPVYRSEDLKPGWAKPIKIMNENFTLYRGEGGAAHVVAFQCAHRGLQLSVGWVEDDCIRCRYHGWKYDATGQCIEVPTEPESTAKTVRIRSYPTVEYLGFIFAYFGAGEPPPSPHFPDFWDNQKTIDYFTAMMKQKPSMRSGRSLLAQLMAAGEFPVGLGFYGYRMLELQETGMPLEIVQADPVVAWPFRLLLAKNLRHPNAAKLFIDFVLSEEGQRFLAGLGRTVVRPGIKNKYPQLVEGLKLYPVKPDIGKNYEELSKTYYDIVNARY